MKNYIYILIVIGLSSCGLKKSNEKELDLNAPIVKTESPKEIIEDDISNKNLPIEPKVDKPDNTNGISPDFFKINETQFNLFKKDGSKWFISSEGKSRLYFIPYTDYSITTAILTEKEIADSNLVSLLQGEGIQINNRSKTIEIDKIQTEKGIKLGLSIDEVKGVFGAPNTAKQVENKNLLVWQFVMLENGESNKVGGLRPFIIEGLEFIVEMEFLDNKLTQVVYKYEIP